MNWKYSGNSEITYYSEDGKRRYIMAAATGDRVACIAVDETKKGYLPDRTFSATLVDDLDAAKAWAENLDARYTN